MKDDTISRQVAVDTVERMYKACEGSLSDYHDLLVAAFMDLTPAHGNGDTISRAAAIDAVSEGCEEWRGIFKRCEKNLLELPPAQLAQDLPNGCTDTISRAAALSALNEYFVRIGKLKRRGLNKGEKAISLDVVGAINSLPPAQQWIPCSTALPEHDGEYLVTIKAFTIDQAVYADIDIARYTGGKWHKGFPVTAWQPLPSPYREGGQE